MSKLQSIKVNSKYAYLWAGPPLEVGDSFFIVTDGREWEAEVTSVDEHDYKNAQVLGGEYGLSYTRESPPPF